MTTLINKIRTYFLSPDSALELFLRTVYHKVLSTRVYFFWQNYLARRSYQKFRNHQQQKSDPDLDSALFQPKITFLLSGINQQTAELETTLHSIQSLIGNDWEAVIISNNKELHHNLAFANDSRVTCTEEFSNNLIKIITGEYVVFCEAGDRFHKSLLAEFYNSITENSPNNLTYYDCEYYDEDLGGYFPNFKPSAFSPALLLSVNYLSHAFIHYSVLEQMWPKIITPISLIGLETEIILYLCECQKNFHHISEILLTQKRLITPGIQEVNQKLTEYLTRQGCITVQSSEHIIGTRFTWQTSTPTLAIIILSKNNHRFLQPLIPALLKQPFEGKKEIFIVDNDSDSPQTIAYYQELRRQPNIGIIPYSKTFNYSEAINLGVGETKSELVLLMNDDMAVFNDYWLDELAQWAIRPGFGVVGTKLLRKNHTIQHAGIIMGLTGFMGHIYLNAPEDYHGLLGSVNWYRNYLAMTGACQMVRREVFNEVGGYDESYRLAFGDIDFCLKVHKKGYHNIYTPFAQLYHYEGSSRGYETPLADANKGYEEFEDYLINEDPYFSPNLSYSRIPKCVVNKRTLNERQQEMIARREFYLKK